MPAHGCLARSQIEGEGWMRRLHLADLTADEPGKALPSRIREVQDGRAWPLHIPRQCGKHHIVELLRPPSAIRCVVRTGGAGKLHHLGAAPGSEDRRSVGRQPLLRIKPLPDELRHRHFGRSMVANLQILLLEMLPGAIVAEPDQDFVLIAQQGGCGEIRRTGQHAPGATGTV